jgi:hypothetical protein
MLSRCVQGVRGMRVGGQRKLIVPPNLVRARDPALPCRLVSCCCAHLCNLLCALLLQSNRVQWATQLQGLCHTAVLTRLSRQA